MERVSSDVLQRVAALEDLTGNLSDAMDQLGLVGVIPASVLKPNLPLKRMVGQAVTVRNVERSGSPLQIAQTGQGKMGEHEAYNLTEPGDVVVIEGLLDVSNMGGCRRWRSTVACTSPTGVRPRPSITDLMAGTVDLINADVPTSVEAGLPALQMSNWYGDLASAGMAPELRKRLEEALAKVVKQPEVAARLADAGFMNSRDAAGFKAAWTPTSSAGYRGSKRPIFDQNRRDSVSS